MTTDNQTDPQAPPPAATIPAPDQATITRLTTLALQRDLDDQDLAEYLLQHAAMANVIATSSRLVTNAGGIPVNDLQRKAHAMNARMFVAACKAVRRLAYLEHRLIVLKAQAERDLAAHPDSTVYAGRLSVMQEVVDILRIDR